MSDTNPTLYERIGGKTAISTLVDNFYARMQEDYRLNRFFNSTEQPEQRAALKTLAIALLGGTSQTAEGMTALLDHFFMAAFARNKHQSMVTGADWDFFGYIIEQDHPSTQYLCDSHSHFLKFMPDDTLYDAVIQNLAAALRQLPLDSALANEVLDLAETGRNPVLGK